MRLWRRRRKPHWDESPFLLNFCYWDEQVARNICQCRHHRELHGSNPDGCSHTVKGYRGSEPVTITCECEGFQALGHRPTSVTASVAA